MPNFHPLYAALLALLLSFAVAACERRPSEPAGAAATVAEVGQDASEAQSEGDEPLAGLPPADDPYVIVFLGDSLFAGFGLEEGEAAPEVFARTFRHPQGVSVEVVNSGRNGGTAQRALDRFKNRVPDEADAVLIEFGANDVYSGRALQELEADLIALAERARERGARPIIVGMAAPPRSGSRPPSGVWADAARAACADFYPFYFQAIIDQEGRSLDRDLLLPDGIHPNAAGAAAVGRDLAAWMEQTLAQRPPCGEGD
jgi:acyl-CoA thioesterase-1